MLLYECKLLPDRHYDNNFSGSDCCRKQLKLANMSQGPASLCLFQVSFVDECDRLAVYNRLAHQIYVGCKHDCTSTPDLKMHRSALKLQ